MHGDGVKVMMHERTIYPSPKVLEFLAAAGHETIAQLDGTQTIITPEVFDLSSYARGCSSGSRWDDRQDNCFNKCQDDYIWKYCGCHPLSAIPMEHGKQRCDLNHIPCLASHPHVMLRSTILIKNSQCTCLPNCESTTYRVALTAAPLNAAQYNLRPF